MKIPTLSLQQPYANALLWGPKTIENRPRRIFRVPPGGIWLAIHASRTFCGGSAENRAQVCDLVRSMWPEMPPANRLPLGCILGAVRIDWESPYPDPYSAIHDGDPLATARDADLHDDPWAFGPWCYHVAEKRVLTHGLPATGALGLWDANDTSGRVGFTDRVREDRIGRLLALVPEWGTP